MIVPTLKGKTFEEDIILFCPDCLSQEIKQNVEVPIVSYDQKVVIGLKCCKCDYIFAFKLVLYGK